MRYHFIIINQVIAAGRFFMLPAVLLLTTTQQAGARMAGHGRPRLTDTTQNTNTIELQRDHFIRVQAQKSTCYIGEPITVSYLLYSRLRALSTVVKMPRFEGFNAQPLTDFISIRTRLEMVNGLQYEVSTLFKTQLTPLQEGQLLLDPLHLSARVSGSSPVPAVRADSQRLDQLLNTLQEADARQQKEQLVTIKSRPQVVNVLPTPARNRPENFLGLIGPCKLESVALPEAIHTGQKAVLSFTIRGSGSLGWMDAPVPAWPRGIDLLEVATSEDSTRNSNRITVRRRFTYYLTAEQSGMYSVPRLTIPYFDPRNNRYDSLQLAPYTIHVVSSANPAPEKVQTHQEQPLRTPVATLVLVLTAFAITGGTALTVVLSRRTTVLPFLPFAPLLPDPIEIASKHLAASRHKAFYRALHGGLTDLLALKLALLPSEQNKQTISRRLLTSDWAIEEVRVLEAVLNTCEANSYLPGYPAGLNCEQLLEQARKLLDKVKEMPAYQDKR